MRHIEAQQIENLFAGNIRESFNGCEAGYDKLYEIRLRVGRPLFLTYDGGKCFSAKTGSRTVSGDNGRSEETLEYVTGPSCMLMRMRSDEDLSVFRWSQVGVTGKVVLDQEQDHGNEIYFTINVRHSTNSGCAR